jgi:trans-2,3-dihydro-3-hydroxyanthranilate isomerase
MDLRYVIADVFTDTPLAGNPVAVFTDGRDVGTDRMQRLAREMNLSETMLSRPRVRRSARPASIRP